jgi:hypothetical protein
MLVVLRAGPACVNTSFADILAAVAAIIAHELDIAGVMCCNDMFVPGYLTIDLTGMLANTR